MWLICPCLCIKLANIQPFYNLLCFNYSDNDDLKKILCVSFRTTVRYHLGTISLGSLIMTLFKILRAIIRSFTESEESRPSITRACIEACLDVIEQMLKYFTRNVYIETGE